SLHLSLAGVPFRHDMGLAALRSGLLHADLECRSWFCQWRGTDHALLWHGDPADTLCSGGTSGSAALLADLAQFASRRGCFAHCIWAAYPLGRDSVLLKPYPKRMS